MLLVGACIVQVVGPVKPDLTVWRVKQQQGFSCIFPPLPLLAAVSPRVNAPGYQIPQGYVGGAYWIFNSSNISSNSVTLYGSGNFAFQENGGEGGHSYENITLKRFGNNLISSNTDGFHSFSVGKGPTINGAHLSFMGDDVANFHNRVLLVLDFSPPDQLLLIDVGDAPSPSLSQAHPYRSFSEAAQGDLLTLAPLSASDASTKFSLRANPTWVTDAAIVERARNYIAKRAGVAINPAGVGVWSVFLSPNLTASLPVGKEVTVQLDKRSCSGASVRNSRFSDAYDSCFRFQSSSALVANNVFERIPGGVSVGYDPEWLEGSNSISNVLFLADSFCSVLFPAATNVDRIFSLHGLPNVTQRNSVIVTSCEVL